MLEKKEGDLEGWEKWVLFGVFLIVFWVGFVVVFLLCVVFFIVMG